MSSTTGEEKSAQPGKAANPAQNAQDEGEEKSAKEEKNPNKVTKELRDEIERILGKGDVKTPISIDPSTLSYAAKSYLRRRCEKKMRHGHILLGDKQYNEARDAFLRAKTVLESMLGREEDAINDADHSMGYACFQLAQGLARSGDENIQRGELMSASMLHLEDALEKRRSLDGAMSERTGLTLDLLAIVQLHAERFREAAMFAQQAQNVWAEVEGERSLRLADSQCAQGRAFLALEAEVKAAAVYKKAVNTRKLIVAHYLTLKTTVVKGDVAAGEEPKVIERQHKDTRKHKLSLAQTQYNYALALHDCSRFDDALDSLVECFQIRVSLGGFKPPTPDGKRIPLPSKLLVDTQQLMGKCHLKKRDYGQASKHFRIALSMQLEILDAEDIESSKAVNAIVGNLMHYLGVSLTHDTGRQEGLVVLKRAVAIRDALGLRKQQAISLRALAKMYALRTDSYQDALDELKNALAIQSEAYKKPHREQANTLSSIGYTHCLMRHYKQALKQYQRGLEVIGKAEGYHSKSYGQTLFAMAHMHVNLNEMANAKSLCMQAKVVLERACSSPKTADPTLLKRVQEFLSSLVVRSRNQD